MVAMSPTVAHPRTVRAGHLVLGWSLLAAGAAVDLVRALGTYASMHLVLIVAALVFAHWRREPRLVTVVFWAVAGVALAESFLAFLGDGLTMAHPWWGLGAVVLLLGGVGVLRQVPPR
ncbi:hypothetical protein [Antribacter gilvus]|uniref:hypothetical protein n=1 Tax=Antribacter gilvus TaxID=2304675 RepID=UPI000F7B307B|nr:hypothetical protein [Antribacter gilvus]